MDRPKVCFKLLLLFLQLLFLLLLPLFFLPASSASPFSSPLSSPPPFALGVIKSVSSTRSKYCFRGLLPVAKVGVCAKANTIGVGGRQRRHEAACELLPGRLVSDKTLPECQIACHAHANPRHNRSIISDVAIHAEQLREEC